VLHFFNPLDTVLYKRMGRIDYYCEQLAEKKSREIIENVGLLENQDMWDFVLILLQYWVIASLLILIIIYFINRLTF
jgi:hypothetical protein